MSGHAYVIHVQLINRLLQLGYYVIPVTTEDNVLNFSVCPSVGVSGRCTYQIHDRPSVSLSKDSAYSTELTSQNWWQLYLRPAACTIIKRNTTTVTYNHNGVHYL